MKGTLFAAALLGGVSYCTLALAQAQDAQKLPQVTITAEGQPKNAQQRATQNARRTARRKRQVAQQNQPPAPPQQPQPIVGVLAPQNQVLSTAPQPAGVGSVAGQGIAILGGPGQTSFYQALTMMPSVLVESPDPYGLSPTRNISIRGKGDFHLSKNIEGLPIMGIVGGTDLYDLENIRRIDVYRGAAPSDQGLGLSNASGVVNQLILGPQDKAGVIGRQAFGSDSFYKTFVRVDTGLLQETGTKAFISGSNIDTDKWKGAGGIQRQNVTLGVNQAVSEQITVDLNAVYNKYDGNTYRALNYAQAQDIRRNYRIDYNTVLTGNAATDVNYYKYNRVTAEDFAVFGKVDYNFAPGQHLVIKPYFWNNNGANYSASGTSVQIWRQQNQNVGNVAEYQGKFATGTDVVAGYWWQAMQPPPPPTDQRLFTVNSSGGLTFSRWSSLARIDDFTVNSPYVQISQKFGATFLTAGVRYMNLGAPRMQYYNTAGIPDGTYDQALATNPALNPNATVQARDYNEWLPNIAVRHDINAALSANLSYGRRFGRPDWGPQANNFINNQSAFTSKGYTLQMLVDKVRPEVADQVDASLRYNNNGLTIVPTLFYAKHQNRQVKIVDPSIGTNIAYYQGTGSSTEYGAELEATYAFTERLAVFGTGTWASETFDQNTPTLSNGVMLATKGKQLPNTPQVMVKGGAMYQWDGLSVTPIVRYIGPRFGNAANTERVPGYTVADFTASYDIGRHVGIDSFKASISVLNIFNRRYISQISPNDTDLSAGANYYAGAPRTVVGSLTMKF